MFLEALHEVCERDTECPAQIANFEEVQPSFSRFVLTHIRLGLPKQLCQITLPELCVMPKLTHDVLEVVLFRRAS